MDVSKSRVRTREQFSSRCIKHQVTNCLPLRRSDSTTFGHLLNTTCRGRQPSNTAISGVGCRGWLGASVGECGAAGENVIHMTNSWITEAVAPLSCVGRDERKCRFEEFVDDWIKEVSNDASPTLYCWIVVLNNYWILTSEYILADKK
jgi:hypothetical protein